MQTKLHRLLNTDALDERTLKPIVKLLLMVGALLLMWALVSNLPGIDALVPQTAVTYGAVLGAMLTLGIIAVLGLVAFKLESLVVRVLAGPATVVADVASIAKHIVLFVAVITAHSGLAPLLVPTLEFVGLEWTYDMLFLVLALIPTAVIAITMAGNIDEAASLLSGRLASADAAEPDDDVEPASMD
ncbi:hypothetical protein [Haloferax sp. DFSO52]|uniref:hypothetical protein n=1 Tax=Haloferax sp. DFSO52 TaxID=3388505 RepID=UPI003A8A1472